MAVSIVLTLLIYAVSMAFLPEYFGEHLAFTFVGWSFTDFVTHRPLVRIVVSIRVESCGYRGDQRIPLVHYQVHP